MLSTIQASVNLSLTVTPDYTLNGTTGYLLRAEVNTPKGFTKFMKERDPHYCFVFTPTDLNSVDNISFNRVATIQDLESLSTVPTQVGVSFRKNVYSKFFESVEQLLAAKQKIMDDVRILYSDLNSVFTYVNRVITNETMTMPDLVEDQINTYITDLINKRTDRSNIEALISVIEDTTIPYLTEQVSYFQLSRDFMQDILNEYNTMNINVNITGSLNFVNNMRDSFEQIKSNVNTISSSGLLMQTSLNTLYGSTSAVEATTAVQVASIKAYVDDLLAAGSISGTIHDNLIDSLDNLETDVTDSTTTLKSNVDTSNTSWAVNALPDLFTDYNVFNASIKPALLGLETVRNIMENSNTKVETLKLLLRRINNHISKVNAIISGKNAELDDYKASLEVLKGEIQIVEANLRRLVPTIDIDNPQYYWLVNVNIVEA